MKGWDEKHRDEPELYQWDGIGYIIQRGPSAGFRAVPCPVCGGSVVYHPLDMLRGECGTCETKVENPNFKKLDYNYNDTKNNIIVTTGYFQNIPKPFVTLKVKGIFIQISPLDAKALALSLLDAAESIRADG